MTKVTIVQELLAQYRVPFYEQLRAQLTSSGIELELVHGSASGERALHGDEASLQWATQLKTFQLRLGKGRTAVWQPAIRLASKADLVIVEHANRQLVNYLFVGLRRLGRGPKVAFWGHGANLQARNSQSLEERFKRFSVRWPDWWFAYTHGSADRIERAGFPRHRITTVQNAVDTAIYRDVAVARHPRRCIYVGSLHKHKRIDYLLEAAGHAASMIEGFELVVVGDGAERWRIEEMSGTVPWMRYRGALFGHAKAMELAASSLTLMPGLVGLGILDSFAGGAPIVTTSYPWHSPEIEYLSDGSNGVIAPREASPREFAEIVVALLNDPGRLESLRQGCQLSATQFTVENMSHRFAAGIVEALEVT